MSQQHESREITQQRLFKHKQLGYLCLREKSKPEKLAIWVAIRLAAGTQLCKATYAVINLPLDCIGITFLHQHHAAFRCNGQGDLRNNNLARMQHPIPFRNSFPEHHIKPIGYQILVNVTACMKIA